MSSSNIVKATIEHCVYSFEVLIAKLKNLEAPKYPASLPKVKAPLFVTWHHRHRIHTKNQLKLRGCIGINKKIIDNNISLFINGSIQCIKNYKTINRDF